MTEDAEVFEVVYPFVRDTFTTHEADSEGAFGAEIPTWKPGTRNEMVYPDDCESVADALGAQILTVVSRHKPGRFPARVFYTRQWRDPDGRVFGKGGCRVATAEKFKRLSTRYGHPFKLKSCGCDGCKWPTTDHRASPPGVSAALADDRKDP
jgi:hypothetical protein